MSYNGPLPILTPPQFGQSTALAPYKPSAPIVIRRRGDVSAATMTYEHPDLDDNPQEDPFLSTDLTLASRIREVIEQEYPGHNCFEVEVGAQYGVAQIRLRFLMKTLSFVCHVEDLIFDPRLEQVRRGCGELLERFGLSRSNLSREDMAAAIERAPIWRRSEDEVPGGNYARTFKGKTDARRIG